MPNSLQAAYDKFLDERFNVAAEGDISRWSSPVGQAYNRAWREFGRFAAAVPSAGRRD